MHSARGLTTRSAAHREPRTSRTPDRYVASDGLRGDPVAVAYPDVADRRSVRSTVRDARPRPTANCAEKWSARNRCCASIFRTRIKVTGDTTLVVSSILQPPPPPNRRPVPDRRGRPPRPLLAPRSLRATTDASSTRGVFAARRGDRYDTSKTCTAVVVAREFGVFDDENTPVAKLSCVRRSLARR